jgi:hypothetical protein
MLRDAPEAHDACCKTITLMDQLGRPSSWPVDSPAVSWFLCVLDVESCVGLTANRPQMGEASSSPQREPKAAAKTQVLNLQWSTLTRSRTTSIGPRIALSQKAQSGVTVAAAFKSDTAKKSKTWILAWHRKVPRTVDVTKPRLENCLEVYAAAAIINHARGELGFRIPQNAQCLGRPPEHEGVQLSRLPRKVPSSCQSSQALRKGKRD